MRLPLLTVLACALLAPAASADWLVTEDGARIETEGPWRVEGRRVIFTLPNGTLSALRTSEVDLDASAEATAAANAPAPAPDPAAAIREEPPEPILVLTDKDIPRAVLDQEPGEEPPSRRAGVGEVDEDEQPVRVVSWRQVEDRSDEGLELHGSVRNTGKVVATDVSLSVGVKGEDGSPLATVDAFLDTGVLIPGRTTGFRAVLPGIFELHGEPEFIISSDSVSVGTGRPEDEAVSEDELLDETGELAEEGDGSVDETDD